MKKISLIFLAALMLVLGACNNRSNEVEQSKNEKVEEKNTESKKETSHEGEEIVDGIFPPMAKVRGKTYVNTGYQNSMVSCGTAAGEIKTDVGSSNEPQNDDEGNFGKGYAYQLWEEGYINVKIDDKWYLFKDINLKNDGDEIPKWVGHFTGKVIGLEEDSLMVEPTHIDDEFYFKDILTKPISLPIENLENSKDGVVTTEGLEGKSVEIYFGGEIKNTEKEKSQPIFLEEVYKIYVK